MFSAKRCGSTAVFKMFQKHPDVGVCYYDKNVDNWEPNFWNLAVEAINGNPSPFIERFKISHPFLEFPDEFTEDNVFQLWDKILEVQGPVVFDKSPQYLGDEKALNLLLKYKSKDNDIRIFAMIRDPRDSISSQYELWNKHVDNDSPKFREKQWLEKYHHLEKLNKDFGFIPIFKYEDFAQSPNIYAPMIFNYCGIDNIEETYNHIKPTHIGRYSTSLNYKIRNWKFNKDFENHLRKYGYSIPQLDFSIRYFNFFKELFPNIIRIFRRNFGYYYKKYFLKQ